ncbi:hypothetical protein A0H81_08681 [Grifola frondosa]|uniref:SH3 domain-containing protein n=1 Tax=Grifola frondosa TaxID=5627 RepID=A0A1C7M2X7_GRIFR|nr:hypothetical protein A0H81_08681 [Grifola frondosa]
MHGVNHVKEHRHRRAKPLEERDPALIDLPFSLPSIPIVDPLLNPILTPLIAGKAPPSSSSLQPSSTSTSATSATQASLTSSPLSSPSASSGPSSGNNGNGNGSGNGSNNGNGDGNGSGGESGSNGISSGDSGNASTASNSAAGSDSSNTQGSSPSPQPTSSPGGDSAHPSSSDASALHAGISSTSAGVQLEGSANAKLDSGPSTTPTLSPIVNVQGAAFQSGTTSAVPTTTVPSVNDGTSPTVTGTTVSWSGTGVDSPSGRASGSTGGSDSGSTDSNTPSSGSGDAASPHHGLTSGAIAAIVVVLSLLSLLLILLLLRKRLIAARADRRKKWWFSGSYGSTGISSAQYFKEKDRAGTKSARSSFATTFDRGQSVTPTPWDLVPAITTVSMEQDHMSEVWPNNLSGSLSVPEPASTVATVSSATIRSVDFGYAQSLHTDSSVRGGSVEDARAVSQMSQYLLVPDTVHSNSNPFRDAESPSPFSVRPFSPSESWSFPKPPKADAQSRVTSVCAPPPASPVESLARSEYGTAREHPSPEPDNPFSDSARVDHAARTESALSTDTETATHFAKVETISRPFVPTMDDEMAVVAGEQVRMLRRFDDGWAYAEKVLTLRRGLIPIDCLRDVGEDLPAFLAKKRLSSYRGCLIVLRIQILSILTITPHIYPYLRSHSSSCPDMFPRCSTFLVGGFV